MVLKLSFSRFPHSDICGLLDICSSPQLFAACHVLLRLPVPRHPPCALFCLTSFLMYSVTLAFLLQWLYLSFGSSIAFFVFVLVCFFLVSLIWLERFFLVFCLLWFHLLASSLFASYLVDTSFLIPHLGCLNIFFMFLYRNMQFSWNNRTDYTVSFLNFYTLVYITIL